MPLLPENFPGEKLLTRIWETLTEKGVGGLLSPWQVRREGRAHIDVRRDELLMLAQAENDIADVRAGRARVDGSYRVVALPAPEAQKMLSAPNNAVAAREEVALTPVLSAPDFIQVAQQEAVVQQLEEAVNLRKTIIRAEEAAERIGDSDVSDGRIDPDWFVQWRSHAQTVSDETMQTLWASILAGEAKEPGKYALRTMSFVRELSKAEAELIALAARFVIEGRFVFPDDASLDAAGLHIEARLALQDLGVLGGLEAVGGYSYKVTSGDAAGFRHHFIAHGVGLYFERDTAAPPLEIPCYTISKIGREVLSLGTFLADGAYMRALGQHIKNAGFKVRYGPAFGAGNNFRWTGTPIEL